MTPGEALTRFDAWKVFPWGQRFRVGQGVDARGTIHWHRGYSRYPGTRREAIITFTIAANAEARAGALNLADAKASR